MKRDYYSQWSGYAYPEEGRRFVSDDIVKEELCEEICLNTDTKRTEQGKSEGGGIPILVESGSMYVLKDGHTLVQGESGSKKSRSVVRPAVMAAVMKKQSMIITDPKGEISSDSLIMGYLQDQGIDTYVLDMREFSKAGFNFLEYPLQLIKQGNMQEAASHISRFVHSLVVDVVSNDDFWNNMAVMQIEALITLILEALAQKEDGEIYANISSILAFVSKDKNFLTGLMEEIAVQLEDELYNPAAMLQEIYKNPEKTYACVNSSTVALLKDFMTQESLTKMLSVNSFDIKEAYKKPMAIFLVIPDETKAFDHVAGELIDTMYQQLVSEYAKTYQSTSRPECQVHFILDEFCNVRINDMASKVSAARSRDIFFTLIYQSDKQLEKMYEDDAGTIKGNCKNFIFLGSSDYEVLSDVSDMTGTTGITKDGSKEAVVTVEDLRKMKKCKEYKDALLIRENILYCAKLMDYEQFECLNKYRNAQLFYRNDVASCNAQVYTPEHLFYDIRKKKVSFPYWKNS